MTDGTPLEPLDSSAGKPPEAGDGSQPESEPAETEVEAPGGSSMEPGAATDEIPASTSDPGDLALIALIDRLAGLLDRSELTELEVQVGGTGLVLRKPIAVAPVAVAAAAAPAAAAPGAAPGSADGGGQATPSAPSRPSVKAPLTGIWYAAPSVGTAPYVTVGGEVAAGQVIGLIEAMKLFNEIKSDLSGRVVKIQAENGKLVKARQPLIEVDPL